MYQGLGVLGGGNEGGGLGGGPDSVPGCSVLCLAYSELTKLTESFGMFE